MVVVDASVIVAANRRREPDYVAVRDWYERMVRDRKDLIAPSILLSEVAAGLSRDESTAQLAATYVEGILSQGVIGIVPVTPRLGLEAGRIAVLHGLRGCDAIYVALAGQLGMPLVTLDRQQLERGSQVVQTLRPGE